MERVKGTFQNFIKVFKTNVLCLKMKTKMEAPAHSIPAVQFTF